MIGTNDRGEEVWGRFTFVYNNDCDVDAYGVMDGDVYAWNEFTDVENAIVEFCPTNRRGGGVVITSRPTGISMPSRKPTVS
jgi:hypothetical protein